VPIYDYSCTACGRVTEVIHGIHAAAPLFCPACGAEGTLRKALSTPAIVFKGSGWAKVDRRSSSSGSGTRTVKPRGSETATTPEAGAGRASSDAAPAADAGGAAKSGKAASGGAAGEG
jgi:putative FmdB family regulatory protein